MKQTWAAWIGAAAIIGSLVMGVGNTLARLTRAEADISAIQSRIMSMDAKVNDVNIAVVRIEGKIDKIEEILKRGEKK